MKKLHHANFISATELSELEPKKPRAEREVKKEPPAKKIHTKTHKKFIIKTDDGPFSIHVHGEPSDFVRDKENTKSYSIPKCVDMALSKLRTTDNPMLERLAIGKTLTVQPVWTQEPMLIGFYVRWQWGGFAMTEVYYGGPDTPPEYLNHGEHVHFFGPFHLPLVHNLP